MPQVKICGVTTLPDALAAARAGAAFIGLNFYTPGPRYIEPASAAALAAALRAQLAAHCPLLVGVFVNETKAELQAIYDQVRLDFLQLSGDEPPELLAALHGRAFKAIRPKSVTEALALAASHAPGATRDERAPALLLDAYHAALYGGTGMQASRAVVLAVKALVPRVMVAGGLTPANVADLVAAANPWGVDTASGVENGNPRRKDHASMEEFIKQAKAASQTIQ